MEILTVDLPAPLGPTELILIIVVYLLLGIASAVIARNKGRSGCGWFLLGFLLGPIGLILALVISRNQPDS